MIERAGGKGTPSDDELDRSTPAPAGGREVRIGIFVITGITALLLVLFLLTDPATFRGRYMVHTEVVDAGGLRQGDPVQMRGVNIGRVHRFDLTSEGVEITLEVEGRWDIPTDSRAHLGSGDLLGGRTVEIIPGEAGELLEGGGRIPGTATTRIFDRADELGDEAVDLLDRFQNLLSDPTVAAAQEGVQEMRELAETLSGLARSQRGELERLIASLNRSAEGIEEAAGSGPELARAIARADSTVTELRSTAERIHGTSRSLDEMLGRIQGGEGTLGQLAVNDSLYRNLNLAAENIHRAAASISVLAEDVRENPGRYIRFRLF